MTGPTLGTTRPRVHLYDPSNTYVGDFLKPSNIYWQDQLSQAGVGSVMIALDDPLADQVVPGAIIKFSLRGAIRFGVRVLTDATDLAVEGAENRLIDLTNQPCLFATLNDGAVYPEYGLKARSGNDRLFGFMSATVGTGIGSDWGDCLGDPRNSGFRKYLTEFTADNPDFISVDPTASVSTFSKYYFRTKTGVFTLGSQTRVRFTWGFDNFGKLYCDGQLVLQSDYTNYSAFKTAITQEIVLDPGDHILAVELENDFELVGTTPMATIGTVWSIDTNGDPVTLLFKTQAADWIVNDGTTPPGWHRGQVVYTLLAEATGMGVRAASMLAPTFSMSVDSNGDAYTDTPDTFSLANGQGLADAFTQLSDKGDCWVNADTMELNYYNRKGTDKSGTVRYRLGGDPSGGSLQGYKTVRTATRRTVVLTQCADGTMLEATDSAGIAAVGKIIAFMSAGSANDHATAQRLAEVQLRSTAAAQITATAKGVIGRGPQLFDDWDLGDTLTVPGHRDIGTMKARAMSQTVDYSGTDEQGQEWPDTLILDGSV